MKKDKETIEEPDLLDMNKEQLIGQIMRLRKKIDKLEQKVSNLEWFKSEHRGYFDEWGIYRE